MNPEQIAIGQLLTVLKNTANPDDRSWIGDVLEVTFVELPFVVVQHADALSFPSPITIDTRILELRETSDAYKRATQSN